MDKIIKLDSRRIQNQLRRLETTDGSESLTYLLESPIDMMRFGYVEEDGKEVFFVDPSGGPMIMKGGHVLGVPDMIVADISHIPKKGYAITFKKE